MVRVHGLVPLILIGACGGGGTVGDSATGAATATDTQPGPTTTTTASDGETGSGTSGTTPGTGSSGSVGTSTSATTGGGADTDTGPPSDPPPGQWGERAELLEANSETAVTHLDGKIYVIGGYPSTRVTVDTVQVYDVASDAWSLTTPVPIPINHTMAAAVGGKIYVTGGQTDAGGSGSFTDRVFELDPVPATWLERAPMPTARSSGGAAVIDGKIYVAGGRPPQGADFAVYDPSNNSWETLPDIPIQRNHLAVVAVDSKVYVVGGRFEAGFSSPRTDVVEVYDPATGQWANETPMLLPRGGLNGVVAYGCIHTFGGEGNDAATSGVFPDHDVYKPVDRSWTALASMPIPVHGVTGAAFIDGLIYLPGGGTQDGGSSGSLFLQVYRPVQHCD